MARPNERTYKHGTCKPNLPRVMQFEGVHPKGKITAAACFFEVLGFRAPKRGEFYASGAVPAAYRAGTDFECAYWIVRPTYFAHLFTDYQQGAPIKLDSNGRVIDAN
jgi:hypothetical protein